MPSRDTTFLDDKEIREKEMLTDRSPLILIVDDDPMQRILVRAVLEGAGFQCDEAKDGNIGLEKCMALTPDLVILDVMMPGRDGFSVCSEVRQRSKICTTPVLMMTALDDLQSIDRAFEVGATSLQTKPINVRLLPYHVKYMLRASAVERETREARRLASNSDYGYQQTNSDLTASVCLSPGTQTFSS
jgi:DNA-binding response OmpR family regulator